MLKWTYQHDLLRFPTADSCVREKFLEHLDTLKDTQTVLREKGITYVLLVLDDLSGEGGTLESELRSFIQSEFDHFAFVPIGGEDGIHPFDGHWNARGNADAADWIHAKTD